MYNDTSSVVSRLATGHIRPDRPARVHAHVLDRRLHSRVKGKPRVNSLANELLIHICAAVFVLRSRSAACVRQRSQTAAVVRRRRSGAVSGTLPGVFVWI